MVLSVAQVRAARGLVGWSKADLAKAAGMDRQEIANFEAGRHLDFEHTVEDLRRALEGAGVIFLGADSQGAGVRLRKGHEIGMRPEELDASNDG